MEVCPSCGEFGTLDDYTGWCYLCTKERVLNSRLPKIETYLLNNANEIEFYIVTQNLSLNKALAKIHNASNRPKCVVCGEVIKRAKQNAVFCRTSAVCRRFSRRYTYLYQEKKISKAEALALVLSELVE